MHDPPKMCMMCMTLSPNRPFAGSGHMVRNKFCWDANIAVGLSKQRNSYQSSRTFLCFENLTALFASQHNLFHTMWPNHAKGLFSISWLLFQGLGKEFIFSHHQKAYEGNRISWYDQQFNKREITESKLPPLRSWDRQKLAWAPEKSDYPTQGLCNTCTVKWFQTSTFNKF